MYIYCMQMCSHCGDPVVPGRTACAGCLEEFRALVAECRDLETQLEAAYRMLADVLEERGGVAHTRDELKAFVTRQGVS